MSKEAFCSPRHLMTFVGLDRSPVQPSDDDKNGQNRAQVIDYFLVQILIQFYCSGFFSLLRI